MRRSARTLVGLILKVARFLWRCVRPTLVMTVVANRRVLAHGSAVPRFDVSMGRWSSRLRRADSWILENVEAAYHGQLQRFAIAETKAVGVLQAQAVLFAGVAFLFGPNPDWQPITLFVVYSLCVVYSCLMVLAPRSRQVVLPSNGADAVSGRGLIAATVEANLSSEIIRSNFVSASLWDLLRSLVSVPAAWAIGEYWTSAGPILERWTAIFG